MKLFRFPRHDPERLQGETPRQRLLRHLIIIFLFFGVIWGFWINQERQLQQTGSLDAQTRSLPLKDETSVLTPEEQGHILAYCKKFRQTYGMDIRLVIRKEPFSASEIQQGESSLVFFLGLCPSASQSVWHIPPLAAAALGEEHIRYLQEDLFSPYFATGNWPEGLAEALNLIARRLDRALLEKS